VRSVRLRKTSFRSIRRRDDSAAEQIRNIGDESLEFINIEVK